MEREGEASDPTVRRPATRSRTAASCTGTRRLRHPNLLHASRSVGWRSSRSSSCSWRARSSASAPRDGWFAADTSSPDTALLAPDSESTSSVDESLGADVDLGSVADAVEPAIVNITSSTNNGVGAGTGMLISRDRPRAHQPPRDLRRRRPPGRAGEQRRHLRRARRRVRDRRRRRARADRRRVGPPDDHHRFRRRRRRHRGRDRQRARPRRRADRDGGHRGRARSADHRDRRDGLTRRDPHRHDPDRGGGAARAVGRRGRGRRRRGRGHDHRRVDERRLPLRVRGQLRARGVRDPDRPRALGGRRDPRRQVDRQRARRAPCHPRGGDPAAAGHAERPPPSARRLDGGRQTKGSRCRECPRTGPRPTPGSARARSS